MKRSGGMLVVGLLLVVAFAGTSWANGGLDHRDREIRPVPLGVSGGNVGGNPRPIICCSGTLGALINAGGQLHILNNNHVLARSNEGQVGEPSNQPGNIAVGCRNNQADYVADLSAFEPLSFSSDNIMDAAIARSCTGQVRTDGFILDIGVPGSSPLSPSVGLGVKKSGRTTGLTTGQVAEINVTVNVGGYCGQCVCLRGRVARFVGQIRITPGTFSAGGDSGSLIVQNVSTAPRPVALLFAGGSDSTIGSPIGPVLAAFGATLVGTASLASDEASSAGGATVSEQELAAAIAIQKRYEEALLSIPGVAGVGIGRSDRTGVLVLRVYLEHDTPELQQSIPAVLEGLAVEKVVTGPFQAQ